jgi:glycerol-3-phosphate dehydrogenase (NAD(P)+)
LKTAVIGSGNMGTAMALVMADNGHTVSCWDHVPEVVEDIRKNHHNQRYLPGLSLPPAVTADHLLHHVVREAQLILICVPSPFFAQVVKEFAPFALPQALVAGASKGLDAATGKRLSEVYAGVSPHPGENYLALSGPSIANEFAQKRPTAVVLAGKLSHAQKAAEALRNPYFHVEVSGDLAGVEIGGVLKNIYAIGLGLLDGLNHGSSNLKSAFATLALAEMKTAAAHWGAKPATLDGLAGLGDLITTGFSRDSHNRRLGELLGTGVETEKALSRLGISLPEGAQNGPIVLRALGAGSPVPLAQLIQTCLNQPSARTKFIDDVCRLLA